MHLNRNDGISSDSFGTIRPGLRPVDDDVTLLIPTLGRRMIRDCLDSIIAGRIWPTRIIVIDQGGLDEISGWLSEIANLGIGTIYKSCKETGRSRALNRGLQLVDSRFVVITDDDCLADELWVRNLGKHLRAFPACIFTGRIAATGEKPMLTTVLSEEPDITNKPGLLFDRLSGGNLGVPIEIFRRVGLFDEDPCVAFSEDGDWAYRALRHGVPIAFAPDAVISHRGWRTYDERVDQYFQYAKSHAAFFGKHLRRGDAFIALRAALHFGRALRRWIVAAISGDRELATNGRAYVYQFLPGLLAGFRSELVPPSLEERQPDQAGAALE